MNTSTTPGYELHTTSHQKKCTCSSFTRFQVKNVFQEIVISFHRRPLRGGESDTGVIPAGGVGPAPPDEGSINQEKRSRHIQYWGGDR